MSDLTAFTWYMSVAGMAAVIDPLTPIAGSGSLSLHRNGTAGMYLNGVRTGAPLGFTSGRIRWRQAVKASDNANDLAGVLFQQSQANMTGASGSAYGVAWANAFGGTTAGNWVIRKYTAGLPTATQLAASSQFAFNTGVSNAMAMEVTWTLDIANLGGIRITVKRGVAADFSDLVLEPGLDIVITASVLQTSVGEGPYIAHGSTTSNRNTLMDSVSAIPLLIGG